jgi:glycosyltransferase involved in cell wall biosynthesis
MNGRDLPLITICIPTKNSQNTIFKVLEAIERLNYPKKKLKVIFVDGYSIDETFKILTEWYKLNKEQFYKIELIQAHTNIPQARNLCIKHMEGEFILQWDSDVVPPSDLLIEMVKILDQRKDIGIIAADYIYPHREKHVYNTNKLTHAAYMGFALIRREVIEKIGGFNEKLSIGEDTEFCIRVFEKGYKILWAPQPVMHLKSLKNSNFKTFKDWLKFNFYVRAKEYYVSFTYLPLLLKARIIYYLLMPIFMFTLFGSSILALIDLHIALLLISLYISPALILDISSKGFKNFINYFKFNLPTGIALSYGVLVIFIKKLIKKQPL